MWTSVGTLWQTTTREGRGNVVTTRHQRGPPFKGRCKMQFKEVVGPGQEDWASGLVIILTVQETVCLDREGKYISVGAWILALSLQHRT